MRYLLARGLVEIVPTKVGRQQKKAAAPRKAPCKATAVYFIQAVTVGLVKIGKAECVMTRFRTLRTNSPDTLRMLGVIQDEDAAALEARLHKQFAAHRAHGEWFRPADELLDYIRANVAGAAPMRPWRETRYPALRSAPCLVKTQASTTPPEP